MARMNHANVFVVSANDNTDELVISCYQEYQDFIFPEVENGELQTVIHKDQITDIVMSITNAKKLFNILSGTIQQYDERHSGGTNG